jgi:hypothetical protein
LRYRLDLLEGKRVFGRRQGSVRNTAELKEQSTRRRPIINMSQTNATTGVASSGNTVEFSKGRSPTGEQVLGKEEKLGELVYKFNTKDQADMYLRTTEAIADFVGVEYGRDTRMLVKHGTEKTFTKPRIPRSDGTTPGLMEKYKTELRIFHRDKKEFQDNKAKVFVIIL